MAMTLFNDKIDVQSKGRNGWFWPKACSVLALTRSSPEFILIEVEGSKSIKGAAAPISIRLSRKDARNFGKAILAAVKHVEEAAR